MKYVSELKGIEADYIVRAEELFERLIGYSLGATIFNEKIRYSRYGVPLKHRPVIEILSIKGRTSNSGSFFDYKKVFGTTHWCEIDLKDVVVSHSDLGTTITLPPTIFGTMYDEVDVEYKAGLTEIPDEVEYAVFKIAQLLSTGAINEWNLFLPDDILDIIDSYRKGAN